MSHCEGVRHESRRAAKALWTLLAVTSLGGLAIAGPPVLVKDINTVDVSDSVPSQFVAAGNKVFFIADDGVHGSVLHASDGTSGGTQLLIPNQVNGSSWTASQAGAFAGGLLFSCNDGVHGEELWYSDGTPAGTHLVIDLLPGSASSFCRPVLLNDGVTAATVNGKALVRGTDSQGQALFLTDGTEAGTTLLYRAASSDAFSSSAEEWNGGLALINAGSPSTSIWKTDGTTAGTQQIVSGTSARQISWDGKLLKSGSLLYFLAHDGTNWWLWRTDGTGAGTIRLKPASGAQPNWPVKLAALNGKVVFAAGNGASGSNPADLWVTDGTVAGTVRLKAGNGIARYYFFYQLVSGGLWSPAADHVVFAWENELWRTDGTLAGTTLLAPLSTAGETTETYFGPNIRSGNLCYFPVRGGGSATPRLFVTDGTSAGSAYVCELASVDVGDDRYPLIGALGSDLVFASSRDASSGLEVWRTNGTAAGTSLVRDVFPGPGGCVSSVSSFSKSAAGRFFFSGWDGTRGHELYATDGTSAGTALVADINTTPKTASSSPRSFVPLGDRFVFVAFGSDVPNDGRHLWASDGTADGTQVIAIAPQSGIAAHAQVAGRQFLLWDSSGFQPDLWVTDTTVPGTGRVRLFDYYYIDNRYPVPTDQTLAAVANGVVFGASTTDTGFGAWWSDGTPGAAVLLLQTVPSGLPLPPENFTAVAQGAVFVNYFDAQPQQRLMVTDGSPTGTNEIVALPPSANIGTSRSGCQFVPANGRAVFLVTDASVHSLWSTDGTDAGTIPIASLPSIAGAVPRLSGTAGGGPAAYLAINYYQSSADIFRDGLVFRTDGTPEGTSQEAAFPVSAGRNQSFPTVQALTAAGSQGIFYVQQYVPTRQTFAAVDSLTGLHELPADVVPTLPSETAPLPTQGSVAYFGGKLKTDPQSTPLGLCATNGASLDSSVVAPAISPGAMLVRGRSIFFSGSNGATGQELWRIDLCPTDFNLDGVSDAVDFGEFTTAFIGGLSAADFDGNGFLNGDDFDAYAEAFEQGCD